MYVYARALIFGVLQAVVSSCSGALRRSTSDVGFKFSNAHARRFLDWNSNDIQRKCSYAYKHKARRGTKRHQAPKVTIKFPGGAV